MKFGKDISAGYRFSPLPEPEPMTGPLTARGKAFAGSTNWTEAYWKGTLYPAGTRPDRYLSFYSRTFSCIELNTTYYRTPDIAQVLRWKEQTPEGFRFCPKVSSRISQERNLGMEGELWPAFTTSMAAFGDRLGPCFLQLPEHFDATRFRILCNLMESGLPGHNMLFELRHPSWFQDRILFTDLCALLHSHHCGLVVTDTPGRQDVRHLNLCCKSLIVRYVSNGIASDDRLRIDDWIHRSEEILTCCDLYFIFHHPDPASMIAYAGEWQGQEAIGN